MCSFYHTPFEEDCGFFFFLLQTLERCVCVNTAYSEDLYSVSCQSSRLAGAPLLILFYLRATLNINVILSLNYSLESLPGLTAFVYLHSTLPIPPPLCALHSTTPGCLFHSEGSFLIISDAMACWLSFFSPMVL